MAEARRAWRAELAGVDPARLVFVDETGIDTRMARPHGRAAPRRAAPRRAAPRRARAAGARQAALGALGAADRHRRPRARSTGWPPA